MRRFQNFVQGGDTERLLFRLARPEQPLDYPKALLDGGVRPRQVDCEERSERI